MGVSLLDVAKALQSNLMYCNQTRPSKLGPLPATTIRGGEQYVL